MANTSLWIDGRMAVNGRQSHVNLSNPIALHDFIRDYLAANPTLITGVQTLAQVLAVGAVTGGLDIEISNGDVIKAVSGDSTINLRNGVDDVFQITNSVVSLDGNTEAIRLASTVPTSAAFMSKSEVGTYSTTGTVPTVMPIQVVSNAGTTTSANNKSNAVYINTGGDATSTYNAGITNSVILGGSGITAKTSGIAYANQLGLNASGSAFETLIDTATLTANRTAEFPNASGVIGLIRYVGVTTPTVHTATTGEIVGVTTGAGALVVNLPVATTANQLITIKKVDVGAGAVTITAAGAELIDGLATLPLAAQYNSATLVSDGTGWMVIATV